MNYSVIYNIRGRYTAYSIMDDTINQFPYILFWGTVWDD